MAKNFSDLPGVMNRLAWWMVDDGKMERPTKPAKDYPKDYPNYE
jgi:hypothetical protein